MKAICSHKEERKQAIYIHGRKTLHRSTNTLRWAHDRQTEKQGAEWVRLVAALKRVQSEKMDRRPLEGLSLTEHTGLWPRGEMDRVGGALV